MRGTRFHRKSRKSRKSSFFFSSSSSSSSLLLPRFFPLFCLCEMCFLCDVSLSLLEKRSVLKVQKKAVVVKSPFVQKERQKERKKERKKEDEKKLSGGRNSFWFFRPKAHKKLLSSFSLDASVEEN